MHNVNKKSRKPRSQRSNQKKPLVNGVSTSLIRPGPVPSSTTKTFTYSAIIGIGGITSFNVYDFRINSIFAPDFTVGLPAVGEAAWANFYGSYKVENFKMQYEFVSSSTTANQTVGFTFKDYQPSTNISSFLEAEHALSTSYATGMEVVGLASGMSRYKSPWLTIPPKAVLGNRIEYIADRDFVGLMGVGNPSQVIWGSFICLNNVTSTTSGTLIVNFEYRTKLFSVSQNIL